MKLEAIRIVLVETSHPGNIGAAARAMKTMGLKHLYLVNPVILPDETAVAMASGADDVLAAATIISTLDEAIGDCELIIGTSARHRKIPWPTLTPHQFAVRASEFSRTPSIAVLFGRERTGLFNEELHRCHYHLCIPSHPEYSSLNLAQAVQVVAYELYRASLAEKECGVQREQPLAKVADVELFYQHLERVLIELDFLKPDAPRQLMTRLRRLFQRAEPDVMELNILRGILAAVEERGA